MKHVFQVRDRVVRAAVDDDGGALAPLTEESVHTGTVVVDDHGVSLLWSEVEREVNMRTPSGICGVNTLCHERSITKQGVIGSESSLALPNGSRPRLVP